MGETITCSADGHPDPTINWHNENTGDTLNSPILKITSYMVGLQNYTCEAFNEIRDEVYQVSKTMGFRVKLTSECHFITSE